MLAALGLATWYLVAAPLSQWMGPTLALGRSDQPRIALTFDDGPGPETTQILDALAAAGVRATFFLCGVNVERYPEIVRRIQRDGHEIGNHTYSHMRLLGKSPGRIALEIDRGANTIERCTGQQPRLFRPPYGLRWFGLFPILRQREMQAVMWSVNALDWRSSASHISARVLRQIHPGAIVLLHDGVPPQESGDRRATAEALPEILRELKRNYQAVTISELQSQSS